MVFVKIQKPEYSTEIAHTKNRRIAMNISTTDFDISQIRYLFSSMIRQAQQDLFPTEMDNIRGMGTVTDL